MRSGFAGAAFAAVMACAGSANAATIHVLLTGTITPVASNSGTYITPGGSYAVDLTGNPDTGSATGTLVPQGAQTAIGPFNFSLSYDQQASKLTIAATGDAVQESTYLSFNVMGPINGTFVASSPDVALSFGQFTYYGNQDLQRYSVSADQITIASEGISFVPLPASLPLMGAAIAFLAIGSSVFRRSLA